MTIEKENPVPAATLVDATSFRGAMGAIASPVSVVTAHHEKPHGTTVSAFSSLSLDPPMVLVSLKNDSDLLTVVKRTERFCLNILSASQSAIAATFAKRDVDRFAEIPWRLESGVPHLMGVAAWAVCRAESLIVCGDHTILTGLVERADHANVAGLVYQHRRFGIFTPTDHPEEK